MNNNDYNNSSDNNVSSGNIKVNSAYFRKEQYKNNSADAVQPQPQTTPVNRAVNSTQQQTTPINRAVNAAQSQTAPVNRAVNAAQQQTAPVNRAVNATQQQTAPINRAVNAAQQQTAPVNRAVNAAQSQTTPINRAVNATQQQTAPVNSAVNNNTQPKIDSSAQNNQTSGYYSSSPKSTSSESDVPVKVPDLKKHVFYNESALTPPDKKSNAIIMVIFIFLIALLVFGLIGFALTVEEDINKSPYSSYLNANHFDSIFSTSSKLEDYAKKKISSSKSLADLGTQKFSIQLSNDKELFFSIPIRYSVSEWGVTDIELKNFSGDVINLSVLLDDSGSADEQYDYYRSLYSKYWEEPDCKTPEGTAKLICVSEPDGAYKEAAALVDSKYGLISVTLQTERTEDYMTDDLFHLLHSIIESFEEKNV